MSETTQDTGKEGDMKSIRIGGASGYWGESDMGLPQFLQQGDLDYVVFDYLAEITLSIMARARALDPNQGYASDFVDQVMAPHLHAIAKQGVKILSNAGGVNPLACAAALREHIQKQGLDLRVAVITGDDLMPTVGALAEESVAEMFTGEAFPPVDRVASVNAYLGAFPIARALDQGADIVITGRCVDSAVTLGACIHAFGWQANDFNALAGGCLAGHLIECGPQATGGNLTDWSLVADSLDVVGYPIATVFPDGHCLISKPDNTGGCVTTHSVGEQLLYEIGDPSAYYLPDVVADFGAVELTQVKPDVVEVSGAIGRGAPTHLKVSTTWADGWRAGAIWFYVGTCAGDRARSFAASAIARARRKLTAVGAADFDEVLVEVIGDGSHFGAFSQERESREVAVKVGVKHADKRAVAMLLKELTGVGLAAPAGLAGFAGTRPKPSPVIRLFSFLIERNRVPITIDYGDRTESFEPSLVELTHDFETIEREPAGEVYGADDLIEVRLEQLAVGRSGDKGNAANIGLIARDPAYLPWIAAAITEDAVRDRFAHFLTAPVVNRFYLPGLGGFNFFMPSALGGGGVASLRNDPQAKTYAQILLQAPVSIPASLMEKTYGGH